MMRNVIELSARLLELFAVAIIVASVVPATARFLLDVHRAGSEAYRHYRESIGKALLLGLEFLVAADIVRTVVLEPTLDNVVILAVLIAVRTFLSWSVVVEIEGRWPWQARETE